ncbi:40111_t:CDS:2, partial [Gigaspora margarita]
MEIDSDTESIKSDTTEIAELVEIINLQQGENNDLKLLIQLLEAIIIEAASCIKSGLIEIIEKAVNITNMISPIFPIAALINNIFTIYENVRLNEKISKSTIDRIIKISAEKVLQSRGIKTILNATSIRKRFAELME